MTRTPEDFLDAKNLLAFARDSAAVAYYHALAGRRPETQETLMIQCLEKVAERFGHRLVQS